MIIIIHNWKKKLFTLLAALLLIVAFVVAVPYVAGSVYEKIPALTTWFEDEHPTGNPLRVEAQENKTKFDEMVETMVIRLQEFYYED